MISATKYHLRQRCQHDFLFPGTGFFVMLMLVNSWGFSAQAQTPLSSEQLDFFESKIRPVLIENCYECHSAAAAQSGKLRAELALDTRAGGLTGGESGPAVVPNAVDESLIISALRYDSYEMPPSGKLPDEVIADFTQWIEMGAPDPRDGDNLPAKKARIIDLDEGRKFWSFQPLQSTQPVINTAVHPVDQWILKKQLDVGLSLSSPAEPRVLIRRAWFDLLGIPPTPAEMKHWISRLSGGNDSAPMISKPAWSELIDTLLQRPEYGERWARHWMDVVRFAESHGYEQDYDRPNAYHYRDFLIRALNQDLPYDQMVRWQIAGDELQPAEPLAWMATGFLGAGAFPTQLTETEFESARYDELDDMVATTSVAFLGLSIGCARCHDHKFDPIRAEDYYRFAAIFTSAIRSEKVLDLDPATNLLRQKQFDAELQTAQANLTEYESKKLPAEFLEWLQQTSSDVRILATWHVLAGEVATLSGATFDRLDDGSFLAVGAPPRQDVLTFRATPFAGSVRAIRIEALADPSLPNQGPGRAGNGNFALGNFEVNRLDAEGSRKPVALIEAVATHQQDQSTLSIAASIDDDPISGWAVDGQIGKSQAGVFYLAEPIELRADQRLEMTLTFQHPNAHHCIGRLRVSVSAVARAVPEVGGNGPSQQLVTIFQTLRGQADLGQGFAALPQSEQQTCLDWFRPQSATCSELQKKLDDLTRIGPQLVTAKVQVSSEGLPHLPHHADDRGFPHFYPETYVLRRGDVAQKVSIAEAGFPEVLLSAEREPTELVTPEPTRVNSLSSYRRAALANWLTDSQHGAGALVARVMVNRLWQHHIGRGIVATPNDFGESGDRPTHPELLDWLAQELIVNEWKLKPIHKTIMTSDTYLQSNKGTDDPRSKIDPENRWLWYRAPQRLEGEAIRDSLLSVAGQLDTSMYGPGTLDSNMKRRSVYFFIKRSQLIPEMMLFDWPEHLVSIGQRQSTTIAPQALMFMNSPQGRSSAEAFAARIANDDPLESLRQAFELAFGRTPTPPETQLALDFVGRASQQRREQGDSDPGQLAWADFCQMLLGSNEFIYID